MGKIHHEKNKDTSRSSKLDRGTSDVRVFTREKKWRSSLSDKPVCPTPSVDCYTATDSYKLFNEDDERLCYWKLLENRPSAKSKDNRSQMST